MCSCGKVNMKLLPMKIVMFGWFGACACALPFMSVHMKELGLTVKETAIIYTLLPITQTLSTPIAGLIADRLGRYRDVLLVSIVMSIVLTTALLYVPTIHNSRTTNALTFQFLNVCDDKNQTSQQCGIISQKNETSITVFNKCELKCNDSLQKLSDFNNSVAVTLHTHKHNDSNKCDYNILDIQQNNSSLQYLCDSETSLFNCSIICKEAAYNSSSSSGGRYLTFYLYSLLRVLHNIFSAIGYALVNSTALALTETVADMGEYGRQRFWAILAMAIFPPLAGVLVDVFKTGESINYAPAFHTHNILAILTGVAVWHLDFEMEEAPKSYKETFKNFWLLVRNPKILFLLLLVFWLGTVWGFMESFLFWLLQELGSPTYLLGLTVTVGSIVGLPFLFYARIIVSKIGHANVLTIAVIVYMIRNVGAYYLKNAWWILPYETLEIFTYHLMWVAAATYAVSLSPPGLLATVQGFIEGVHFGVGQGSGSLIGGVLMSDYGTRLAFLFMGLISGAVGVIYFILDFFWLRKIVVHPPVRRVSIKSFSIHRNDRKNSTLSSAEVNGILLSSVPTTDSAQEEQNEAKEMHSIK